MALILVLASGACALSYDATTLGVPATLSSSAAEPAQGEHFEVTTRAVWGLPTVSLGQRWNVDLVEGAIGWTPQGLGEGMHWISGSAERWLPRSG